MKGTERGDNEIENLETRRLELQTNRKSRKRNKSCSGYDGNRRRRNFSVLCAFDLPTVLYEHIILIQKHAVLPYIGWA